MVSFNRFLYSAGGLACRAFFKAVGRVKVAGRENIPLTGPVIFAANHVSLADPPLVGCHIPRPIHFMAKKELFDIPLLGWYIRRVNAFPVSRGTRDVAAFKTAQRILNSGGGLILFPEGRRQKSGELATPKSGVGMLAAKTNALVVPVYIHNSQSLFSSKKLALYFGKPLPPPQDEDYEAFALEVMEGIRRLREVCHDARD